MPDRLPFDPAKMAAAKRPPAAAGAAQAPGPSPGASPGSAEPASAPWTVPQLAGLIESAVQRAFPDRVRVVGEVSNARLRTHWYFDLKDGGAVISAVLFASAARRLGPVIEDGGQVLVSGRLSYYAPSGRISLIAEHVEPVGRGAAEARLRALVEEARALGWLDPARKRPMPTFPRRVAVVTSRTGAALQDVIDTARRRCPAVELLVVDVRVQGPSAAGEVAGAIRALSAQHAALGVDALLVTRGGGSAEDLAAFNDRDVAHAIVSCAVPVAAAIGHETDTTLAELVADLRCATPTQAAMRLTPDRAALLEQVDALARRLQAGARGTLRGAAQTLRQLASRPAVASPRRALDVQRARLGAAERALAAAVRAAVGAARRRLAERAVRLERLSPTAAQARRAERLAALEARLARAPARLLERCGVRVVGLARELEAVSPLAVLDRGYSVTTRAGGEAVRDAADLSPGERVLTRVARGAFASVVGEAAGVPAGAGKPARRRAAPRGGAWQAQLDLFGGEGPPAIP